MKDKSLRDRLPELKALIIDSKANNTVKKYSGGWKRWKNWALSKVGVNVIPALPIMVAFYLRDLTEQSNSVATLKAAVYSIQWVHTVAGHQSPTQHPMVKSTLKGARRRLGKPVSPKEPLSHELVKTLACHYNIPDDRLEHISIFDKMPRTCTWLV